MFRYMKILSKCLYRTSSNQLKTYTYSAQTPFRGFFTSNVLGNSEQNSYEMGVYGTLTEEQVARITEGDETLQKKLKVLMLETEVLRQDGQKVPNVEFIKDFQWKELISKETRSGRRKYLSYLFTVEKKKEARQQKKLEAKEKFIESKKLETPEVDDGSPKYGLGHNTFMIRVYDTAMNQVGNNKLIQAMQFGDKLVIDCGYEEHMNKQERMNTAKQLMLLFAENRFHADPFDLHYCNADKKGEILQALSRHIPPMYEPWFPLNVHPQSYLDIFPKDQLVYLTPHCRDDLKEYDHDAIYIVGAMVDKTNNEPLSLAKAKKEGLQMKRLPLDRYLQWSSGSGKSLTLNQMVAIMNDLKCTGNWDYALRHVPRRKIVEADENFNIQRLSNRSNNDRFENRSSNKQFSSSYDYDNRKKYSSVEKNQFIPKQDRKMRKSKLLNYK